MTWRDVTPTPPSPIDGTLLRLAHGQEPVAVGDYSVAEWREMSVRWAQIAREQRLALYRDLDALPSIDRIRMLVRLTFSPLSTWLNWQDEIQSTPANAVETTPHDA